jgi:oligopeptide transport system ATP-binding protein
VTALLELVDLEKYFPVRSGLLRRVTGHVKAVDGVSLSIDRGETLALIGESGSGKSTVARTIVGLHDPTDGRILYNGLDVTDLPNSELARYRSNVQMVFQDPSSSLNPRKRVGQMIAVPLKARNVPSATRRERVESLLEKVGLGSAYAEKYPHQLSGGQKQRVNIARALAVEPEVLLLDEPTSALDVSVQAKLVSLLNDLQAELGLTYLFITHDLSLVRNVADRTAVMYLGQIQERGPTQAVFERPQHPYTRALLSAIPTTSKAEDAYKPDEAEVSGEIPSPRDLPSGCRFHTRCPRAEDACRTTAPDLLDHDNSAHEVRCHLYDEAHADEMGDRPDPVVGPVSGEDD